MIDASSLISTLIFGTAIGCIYILLATGLNLIFGVMKLVNFAHGELVMIGAYIGFTTITALGVNSYVALLLTMPIVAIIGIGVERLVFRKVLGADKLNEIFASLGLILIFDNSGLSLRTNLRRCLMISPACLAWIPIFSRISTTRATELPCSSNLMLASALVAIAVSG